MPPCRVRSCHCEQCRVQKNIRSNRKLKKIIKRLLNKRRRNPQFDGTVFNHYWA